MCDSTTEVVIQELIHECQRNIDEQYNSLVANEYLKQKMKILQGAPEDLDELEQLLKAKEWENEKATYIEDTKESWLQRGLLIFNMFVFVFGVVKTTSVVEAIELKEKR
jgi:hypothetical protein